MKPLNSALCLVSTLYLVAVHFAIQGADFVAALQVLIYAGAIMVLVIFVIMLLGADAEVKEKFLKLHGVIGAALCGIFVSILYVAFSNMQFPEANSTQSVRGTTEAIGALLFNQFLYPFEIVSLLILAATVGAVLLAQDKKRNLPEGRGLKAVRNK